MLSKCLFQFESLLPCPAVLREATNIVQSLFEHSGVCCQLCDPIVKQLPAFGDAGGYSQVDLLKSVRSCLASCIKVQLIEEQTDLIKMCLAKTILHVNPSQRAYDETSQEQYDNCLLLIVVKLTHSVNRFLTAPFYIMRGYSELEKDKDGNRKYLVPAPGTVGTCHGEDRRLVGNLGFAFEDHVLEGRLVAPAAATNTLYANPLVIMENAGPIWKCKYYSVDDERVRTALCWARAPRLATVQHLLLHDIRNTMCAEEYDSKKKGTKRSCSSPALSKRLVRKRAIASKDTGTSEEQHHLDEVLKDSVLRFSDVESEGGDLSEEEMDPVMRRLIYSDHRVGSSGCGKKVL